MNRLNARTTASLLALATALGLAGTAHAAVTVTADAVFVDAAAPEGGAAEGAAADQQQDAAAAPATQAQNDGLTDIVVTATKRETNLQRTPISISVMGAETIRERKVQSLLDLTDGGIPSLRVATFEARQSALTIGIRGIVPLDANQPAREQGVGVYIDGVYLGRQHGLDDVIRILIDRHGVVVTDATLADLRAVTVKEGDGEIGLLQPILVGGHLERRTGECEHADKADEAERQRFATKLYAEPRDAGDVKALHEERKILVELARPAVEFIKAGVEQRVDRQHDPPEALQSPMFGQIS